MSMLLLLSLVLPLFLAALLVVPRLRGAGIAAAPAAPLPAIVLALQTPSAPTEATRLLFGLTLGLDATSRLFLLFTAVLWLLGGLAARCYHADDGGRPTLWTLWLLTLAGNLWLIVSLDAASFYAGFSLMTLAAYGLVVHAQIEEARFAGRVYLALALIGETALLAGLLFAVGIDGDILLPLSYDRSRYPATAAVLIFLGFAVKAGVAGVHVWLPLAHPAAPTPASAVLSGAMIKAGLLGWMRMLPLGETAHPGLGAIVTAAAIASIVGGSVIGLLQRRPKAVLAYSSISQMGFPTLAVGVGLMTPSAWPLLSGAATLYALHHAFAKGALFLGVAVASNASGRGRPGEETGGAPFSALGGAQGLLVLPALALSGFPFTSGDMAKTRLKSALEAAAVPAGLVDFLPAAAVGTTLLMIRFFWTLNVSPTRPARGMAIPMGLCVAMSVGLTWWPFGSNTVWAGSWSHWVGALAPVVVGLLLGSLAIALGRRAGRSAVPYIAPGDVLGWVLPIGLRLWRALGAAAALPDHASFDAARLRRLASRLSDSANSIERFSASGFLLVVVLTVLLVALWR